MIRVVNLKEVGHVEASVAILNMEIENAKSNGDHVLKFIHGYGSHGQGGLILKAVRTELSYLKKRKIVKDYFNGDKWNLFDDKVTKILNNDKTIVKDDDLNKNNPGITIVVV